MLTLIFQIKTIIIVVLLIDIVDICKLNVDNIIEVTKNELNFCS